jgi:Zn-dependent M28 family amino/carboxypeptidase
MKKLIFLWPLLFFACNSTPPPENNTIVNNTPAVNLPKVTHPFNEENAYQFVKKQVDFGPRVPGTKQHAKCHQFFVDHFTKWADTVYLQESTATTFDNKTIPIKNIIAVFNPNAKKRIILCAHWDTRPFADQDTENKNKPILGANDGASGSGVLMEMAQILNQNRIDIGIDIILFDAEDWGDNTGMTEDSYCLGSQYWGKNTHIPNYKADFGILLDMVGAPNAQFGYEGYSLKNAPSYLSLVWETAIAAGYDRYFKNFQRGYITDDHVYMMKYTGIPVIDIIDYDPQTDSKFGAYWHTHQDNMDAIDKKTLKAVGQTLVNVIYNY